MLAAISQKKLLFKKNLQIYVPQLLKVLAGTVIQGHYVCCCLFISVPKESNG